MTIISLQYYVYQIKCVSWKKQKYCKYLSEKIVRKLTDKLI